MGGATSSDPAVKPFSDKLTHLIKEVDDLQDDIKKVKKSSVFFPSESEISSLETHISELNAKKDHLSRDIQKILNDKKLSQNEKYEKLEAEQTTKELEMDEKNNIKNKLIDENQELDKNYNEKNRQIDELDPKLKNLVNEQTEKEGVFESKKKFPALLLDKTNKFEEKSASLNEIELEIENTKSEFREIEDPQNVESEVNRLTLENSDFGTKIEDLKSKLSNFSNFSELTEELSANLSNISLQESQLSANLEEKTLLTQEIEKLAGENSELEQKISEFSVTVDQITDIEAKKNDLSSEIISLNGEIFKNESHLGQLAHQEEKLRAEAAKKEKKRAEVQGKRETLHKLKEELENLRQGKKSLKEKVKNYKEKVKEHKEKNRHGGEEDEGVIDLDE